MTKKETFDVVGMHCASCKILIENTVRNVPGVEKASVNYGTEQLNVEYNESNTATSHMIQAVKELGNYRIVPKSAHDSNKADSAAVQKEREFQKLKFSVFFAGIAAIPFAIQMIQMVLTQDSMMSEDFISNNLEFVLATLVLFGAGFEILKSATKALVRLVFNMDSLITIGTFAAWSYSSYITFTQQAQGEVYFEATVFIIFFILLGRLLESRAKIKTNQAVKALIQLQAKEATILRNGVEEKIEIEKLRVGDIMIVRPGEKIPADGTIIEGESAIDEATITGESIPADKYSGDIVYGASVSMSGLIKIKATKVGNETLLAQVIRLVEEAQATQAPIQKLTDKVSSIFVPTVLVISLITFVFWNFFAANLGLESDLSHSLYIAITVLIIACPCALGLAVPTALIVGSGKAARSGILIKNAEALENLHKVTTIVFDKTGTLTRGTPQVEKIIPINNTNPELTKQIIVSVEEHSQHPLAKSVVEHLKTTPRVKIEKFNETPGKGLKAMHNGVEILIGTRKLLEQHNITIQDNVLKEYETQVKDAKTTIFVCYNGKIDALITIFDEPKAEAKDIIAKLKSLNIQTIMLTGDNAKTANAIAQNLGIQQVIAEVLPQEKAEQIKNLQTANNNGVIAMIGDGINDAPALAQANVGITMGSGTDIAIEAGDVVILNDDLNKVIQAINVSRQTFAVIKQNLFWAFIYNIVGIPVAGGILYPINGMLLSPIIASAAMAFSSISVVANSLRLRFR